MELSFKSFILRERARLAPSERPPTIADAKVAAEALLDAGVNQVWLYGSVARGEAHHNSDIDLVAVVDDLNYRRRPHRCMKLVRVAEDACHYRVEINLTDHPEWRIQRHRVSCSFMTAISCDLKLLAYSTARCVSVNWNKQQVAPTSNAELAIDRLGNVWTSLAKIDASLYPSPSAVRYQELEDPSDYIVTRGGRLIVICEAANMAIENTLKALNIDHGVDAKELWTHAVSKLVDNLTTEHIVREVRRILGSEPEFVKSDKYIEMWRTIGVYGTRGEGLTVYDVATPGFARAISKIACRLATCALEELPVWISNSREGIKLGDRASEMLDYLRVHNLETGKPF